MRCSSCEPLLDRYLEGTLSPREMIDTTAHIGSCAACARLLEEVKVVDALLFTTDVPDLPNNFTFAVMAETSSMPAPQPHKHRLWSFFALYLTAAWIAALAVFAVSGASLPKIGAAVAAAFGGVAQSFAGGAAGIAHGAPVLATFGAGVLSVDLTLAAAGAAIYFLIRPRLAAHLASASEAK
ncbi:MAG TPA: zf-HC2 domain-containing protein [Candidatus Rubrimentiphilum sp.]|nr:zf-HC2 domain-containing protein [Candidatus Rubrimentiphilum sp.]